MTPSEGMDTGLDTADVSVDVSPEPIEAPVEGAEVETQEQQPPPITAPYKPISEDGKRLDDKAKATLEQIKATDPALAKALRDALFDQDRIRRALPGGLKEVNELRQTIEQLGGPEGIQGIQAEVKGWNDFDQNYMAGDPKALEFMLSSPESQQAFMKLAPMAFNKFEELNPEGYASYVCSRIIGDAQSNDIPICMKAIQFYISQGNMEGVTGEFNKINAWLNGIEATAKRPPAIPQAQQVDNSKIKELETQNSELVRNQWKGESAQEQNQIYSSELNRLLAGRKVTDAQREDILLRVQTKLGLRIKDQEKTLNQYFAVKDKNGFLKFASSFSKKHIPELLREAVDRYVPQKPGPKVQQVPQNGKPITPPLGQASNGFQPSTRPERDQIDWGATTHSMMMNRQAVLIGGKKVKWELPGPPRR
jgi:hypothetical protein